MALTTADTAADLLKADREYLIHPLHYIADGEPAIYVSGRGAILKDIAGREYLDGLSGLWNVNVGHGRTELADAAAAQMRELAYCSCFAGSSNRPAIRLAERLIELTRGRQQAVFFTSTGAEANEAAFKTARFYWKALGKPDKVSVITRRQAYHGLTLQAMSATGMGDAYWKMFEPRVPGFVQIPTCYPYRFQDAKLGETAGQAAARMLEEAILREGADSVAAFIAEPIHGAGSLIYPTDDYWPLVRDVCTRHGVLLIADEIITGFCRTGRWFGLEHWDVRPDILSFAKGVTSGYLPLGGMMVTKAIKEVLDAAGPETRWMHASTYSGHPACCAVALANLEIMERERLCANAAGLGDYLSSSLVAAFSHHPHVGDIRSGKGLLAAIELVEDRSTKRNFAAGLMIASRLKAEMLKRAVVTRTRPATGAHPGIGDVIFFAPPLIVTEADIDRLVSVAREALVAVLGS